MSFDVYDCCLEFLASQCDLVVFEHLLSSVLSENQQPELDTSSKINVWIKLYQDPNVLVLSDQPTDVLYEHLDSLASSETQGVTHDVESSNVDNAAEANRVINIANRVGESSEEFLISCEQAFVDYINKSRLSVSNALRIQKLNLFHNESLVRSSTRFSILMAIASKRYNGMLIF
uniref:Uncharacterized protein n=1 Tax=Babesia bovis TaxID=5865 RepID=A7AP73_BABBO|eukprot:XP_001611925.1 hypothetical protein [Babesia bovis T2Bo]